MRKLPLFLFVCLAVAKPHASATSAPVPSLVPPPAEVLAQMEHVADWQLAHPAREAVTDWVQGAGYAGMMALAEISASPRFHDAMVKMGTGTQWKPGTRVYHADDTCVGQTYLELFLRDKDLAMIAPLRARFDAILASPPGDDLDFTHPEHNRNWSWCDSLFMAPPAWVRLAAATGEAKYADFAVAGWWKTSDFLYDKAEHLFFRDSTFFKKKEANGKKVFWGRGNGWVLAGLVRVLQFLPTNHPDRPRFEQLFKDMSAKILTCQQADGLWRASLLDPASYPLKETSGSGFYTYALAWGVNQGLLDRAQFEPAVRKAWTALVSCVDADGKLTHVQPIGSDPKNFADDSTEVYGVGAFLLAGSEIYRLAAMNPETKYGIPKPLEVKVVNPANFWREAETVTIDVNNVAIKEIALNQRAMPVQLVASNDFAIIDGTSSRILYSQVYSDDGIARILFQVDLAPNETKTFYILDASALAAVPPPIVKTFARYVPERFDDFAWESDRIAHRAYGIPLIKAEGTISSAPDVWIKKDRRLIVDVMYATKHYHEDNGEFMDDYRVGHSRGCGGVGIWDGTKLYTSSNWKSQRLITSGPIRSEFELTYDAWDAGNGRMVSETKRYSIDAGSYFTKAQSTFSSDDKSPLTIGVGLAERACPTNREEFFGRDQDEGWLAYWQPEDKPKGIIGDAIVLAKGSVIAFTNDAPNLPEEKVHANVPQPTHEGYPPIRNQLAITKAEIGQPLTYYFGACWDRSGDFTNHIQWENYVKRFAERRDQPLQVTVGN